MNYFPNAVWFLITNFNSVGVIVPIVSVELKVHIFLSQAPACNADLTDMAALRYLQVAYEVTPGHRVRGLSPAVRVGVACPGNIIHKHLQSS